MQTLVIDYKSKEDGKIISSIAKRLNLKTHLLNGNKIEDRILLEMMKERENEQNFPIEYSHKILNKVINKD